MPAEVELKVKSSASGGLVTPTLAEIAGANGTAGTPSAAVQSVQGITGGTVLPVDGGSPVLAAAADQLSTTSFRITSLTNVAQAIKASAGGIYSLEPYNSHTATVFLQIYDVAAASVTVGTTTPKKTIAIPAGAGGDMPRVYSILCGTAISVACTSTYTGGVAPGAVLQLCGEFA